MLNEPPALPCMLAAMVAEARRGDAVHPGRPERLAALGMPREDERGGGAMSAALKETDVHVCVPHDRTARIQEVHILALHCICDGVDAQLLGDQEISE